MNQTQQTQLEAVHEHLISGKSITQLQALKYYGCLRLSAIIYTLRREFGLPIETKRVGKQGYARYFISDLAEA